jgi:phosphate transport system substrate-binding protein
MKLIKVFLSAIVLTSCSSTKVEPLKITGAGATFPMPIYQKWFAEFGVKHPDVQINYSGGGSGAGISQLTNGTVDFGASDMPLTDEQIAAMKVKPLHFPTVMGAVVLTYNVEGLGPDVRFTPELIANIFTGKITTWDDRRLAAVNPGVKFPAALVIPVHRSDSSGTTFVSTDYLSKVNPEFKSKVGANTKVSWPAEGLNGQGNPGVAGLIRQTPGSIGYVELIYAIQNKMSYGLVQNSTGNFTKASIETVTEAAASAAPTMPSDFRVSITNAPGQKAYPISTFTWLLIPIRLSDQKRGAAMKDFLKWMLVEGQSGAPALNYAPLPQEVVSAAAAQIGQVQ